MQQQTRCLLAWLSQQEAVSTLLGHLPGPGEDTAQQQQLWEAARAALQQRVPYAEITPTLVPVPPEIEAQAEVFKQRPDVAAFFQGMDWTVGLANLDSVLSFQKIVVQEQSVERVNAVPVEDKAALFSFCLPDSVNAINLPGVIDANKKAITFSSLNPNLRIGPHLMLDIDVAAAQGQPATKQKFVGFAINFGGQFIQIAEYNERWFIRDGYHRCYGLLRRGINRVPCVFIRATSFEQLTGGQGGFLSYETLFGERPPFLKDFLNDAVSASALRMASRKVVRVSAEDFVVVID
jgi:hypothetical protein